MLVKKMITKKTAALSTALVMSLCMTGTAFAGEAAPKMEPQDATVTLAAITIESQENEDGVVSYFIRDEDGNLQPIDLHFEDGVSFDREKGENTVFYSTAIDIDSTATVDITIAQPGLNAPKDSDLPKGAAAMTKIAAPASSIVPASIKEPLAE